MDINNLTIGQVKEIVSMIGVSKEPQSNHGAVGKKCIVRTYASGVHYGEVVSVSANDGRSRCELRNSRRLWKWVGGLSLSEISVTGINQENSRISTTVHTQFIEDAIEFIPATVKSQQSIEGAKDDNC